MKRVLLIVGLILSLIVFFVMLHAFLFDSFDAIYALPFFAGLIYIFTRKLVCWEGEILTHIGWVLIAWVICYAMLLIYIPIGTYGILDIVVGIVLAGLGCFLVMRKRIRKP